MAPRIVPRWAWLPGALAFLLAVGLSPTWSFTVTLGWEAPTHYTDGTPAPPEAISTYKLYYGPAPYQYTAVQAVGPVLSTTLTGLPDTAPTYVVVTATDQAGTESAASAPELVVTPARDADTTPPTVALTTPAPGTVPRKTTVILAATATDNVRVSSVAFLVDNRLLCTTTAPPYTCAWSVPAPPNRAYRLQAKAWDGAGNIGLSSVVTVVAVR